MAGRVRSHCPLDLRGVPWMTLTLGVIIVLKRQFLVLFLNYYLKRVDRGFELYAVSSASLWEITYGNPLGGRHVLIVRCWYNLLPWPSCLLPWSRWLTTGELCGEQRIVLCGERGFSERRMASRRAGQGEGVPTPPQTTPSQPCGFYSATWPRAEPNAQACVDLAIYPAAPSLFTPFAFFCIAP